MITINYLYYNNKPLFEIIKQYYSRFDLPYKFSFVDDGSQDQPLEAKDMPEGWELYRIKQDLKWNFNGARNLLMHVSSTEWNLLTDLDHVLDKPLLKDLTNLTEKKDPNVAYRFNRIGSKNVPHGSTYLLTKTLFESIGGYQEETTGYGQDMKFARKLGCEHFRTYSDKCKLIEDYSILHLGVKGSLLSGDWKQKNREISNPNYPERTRLRFDWERIV